jgi:hypothetical protein
MLSAAQPAAAQSANDIEFDPGITQDQFAEFARLAAQGIYATPVDSARARGLLGFDIGIAATAVPVDTNALYWQRSTTDDFTISDHVVVPKLVVAKGLSFATISAMYAKVPDTDLQVWGAALDVPIISGGVVSPTVAVRGAYATLRGSENFDLNTYGLELFVSKGFGPVTPYAAIGRARSEAEGIYFQTFPTLVALPPLVDEHDTNRITVGVKLSLLIPKIIVEATQGHERSYAAKVSFGF